MPKFKLLTVGNPKIEKGVKFGYLTAVLHLAPGNLSGYQVCPKATAGCLAACLNTAGRGGITAGKGRLTRDEIASGSRTNAIQAARIRRTRMYFSERGHFMALLTADIAKLVRLAAAHGLKPAVRLNGTSDIPWERVAIPFGALLGNVDSAIIPTGGRSNSLPNIMAAFPDVPFYDYTKRPNRRDLPANYSLTFSLAEGNDMDALTALDCGLNVAAVFHKVPVYYHLSAGVGAFADVPVINGDEHDLRFLDKRGVIVGLKAKGNAKRDTSGFVR